MLNLKQFNYLTESQPQDIGRRSLRSQSTETASTASSSTFPRVCLFCDKRNKKLAGKKETLHQVETINFQDVVLSEAQALEDEKLLRKIMAVDLVAKEACYHNSCRKSYSYQASRKSQEQSKIDEAARQAVINIRKQAMDSTTSYIEAHVIENKEVYLNHNNQTLFIET